MHITEGKLQRMANSLIPDMPSAPRPPAGAGAPPLDLPTTSPDALLAFLAEQLLQLELVQGGGPDEEARAALAALQQTMVQGGPQPVNPSAVLTMMDRCAGALAALLVLEGCTATVLLELEGGAPPAVCALPLCCSGRIHGLRIMGA